MAQDHITIHGARQHNLKNVSLRIPRNKLVVFTGPSGSGKSSLAFHTLYAAGQRSYMESLSAYARQFLGTMDKPDVDYIEGLSPAIAIEQRGASYNPRSTVGTVTEIYDYLRVLYARCGEPTCLACGALLGKQTVDEMTDALLSYPEGTRVQILAPIIRGRKGEHKKELDDLNKLGYNRVLINKIEYTLDDETRPSIKMNPRTAHDIDVVVDRLVLNEDIRERAADSIETALKLGQGLARFAHKKPEAEEFSYQNLSQYYTCPHHPDITMEELQPRLFSFSSPHGACPQCHGIGSQQDVDPELLIPDHSLSINRGALAVLRGDMGSSRWYKSIFEAILEPHGANCGTDFKNIPTTAQDAILYGDKEKVEITNNRGRQVKVLWEGLSPMVWRLYRETTSSSQKQWYEKFLAKSPCSQCRGARLRPEALAVLVQDISIHDLCSKNITDGLAFIESINLSGHKKIVAEKLIEDIRNRLGFLEKVGVGYLTLNRQTPTLSGGESQRIRLATQVGSQLVGVLYVLDEPTIGLHQRDTEKLIDTLKKLQSLGNTLIVVEHDETTILASDYVVDIGPGAGTEGGHLMAAGTPQSIKDNPKSLTGQFLSQKRQTTPPPPRRKSSSFLKIRGAVKNNLKNVDIDIPLNSFVAISGVSGSGKSTLVNHVLAPALDAHLSQKKHPPGCDSLEIGPHCQKLIVVDQKPIGRTPRSNPATYTGMMTPMRELFATLPDAKIRGYTPGRFSFNVQGGRCEACSGDGFMRIEMHFLPDVLVQCDQCNGKRYNRETLEIRYKGLNIADVLNTRVQDARHIFEHIPGIAARLACLDDVGLGYLSLGQSATTLSGGEAQRVKLATELSKKSRHNTIYILDEPTTGLHMSDTYRLLEILNRLIEKGNTALVIEHNMDVLFFADHIIDLGPDGGEHGGLIVAQGSPDDIAKLAAKDNCPSHTSYCLLERLKKHKILRGESEYSL